MNHKKKVIYCSQGLYKNGELVPSVFSISQSFDPNILEISYKDNKEKLIFHNIITSNKESPPKITIFVKKDIYEIYLKASE